MGNNYVVNDLCKMVIEMGFRIKPNKSFLYCIFFLSRHCLDYDVNDNHDDCDVNCSRCARCFKDECPNDGGFCRKASVSETGDSALLILRSNLSDPMPARNNTDALSTVLNKLRRNRESRKPETPL